MNAELEQVRQTLQQKGTAIYEGVLAVLAIKHPDITPKLHEHNDGRVIAVSRNANAFFGNHINVKCWVSPMYTRFGNTLYAYTAGVVIEADWPLSRRFRRSAYKVTTDTDTDAVVAKIVKRLDVAIATLLEAQRAEANRISADKARAATLEQGRTDWHNAGLPGFVRHYEPETSTYTVELTAEQFAAAIKLASVELTPAQMDQATS